MTRFASLVVLACLIASLSAFAATSAQTTKDIQTAGIATTGSDTVNIICHWPNGWIETGPHKGTQLIELCGGSNLRQSAYVIGINGDPSQIRGELYLDVDGDSTTGVQTQFGAGFDYKIIFGGSYGGIIRLTDGKNIGQAQVTQDGSDLVIRWDNSLTNTVGAGNSRYGVVLSTGEFAPDNTTLGYAIAVAPGRLGIMPGSGLVERPMIVTGQNWAGNLFGQSPVNFKVNLEINIGDLDGNWTQPRVSQFRFALDGKDVTSAVTGIGSEVLGYLGDDYSWYDMSNWAYTYGFSISGDIRPGSHTLTVIAITDRGIFADTANWFFRSSYPIVTTPSQTRSTELGHLPRRSIRQ
jgi:hypothetical protein